MNGYLHKLQAGVGTGTAANYVVRRWNRHRCKLCGPALEQVPLQTMYAGVGTGVAANCRQGKEHAVPKTILFLMLLMWMSVIIRKETICI